MKIARINRHIARPVLPAAQRLRIESKRRKVVYFYTREISNRCVILTPIRRLCENCDGF